LAPIYPGVEAALALEGEGSRFMVSWISRSTYKISKLKQANDTRALVQSERCAAIQEYCPWLRVTSFSRRGQP
jgi:hypothetical protein